MKTIHLSAVAFLIYLLLPWATVASAQQASDLDSAVIQAFANTSDGWSSDEVLLNDQRRLAFIKSVQSQYRGATESEACFMLLKLRKAGKLTVKATRRGKSAGDSVLPIAEIAARTVTEKYDVSTDAILADSAVRNAFNLAAQQVDAGIDLYAARKAALQLRKSRRLKPELVLRVADWEKTVAVHSLHHVKEHLDEVPTQPGIYLFRDTKGYVYIGEAINLRARLTQHLSDSDRKSLATYIEQTAGEGLSIEWHAFPKDSPAKQVAVRRAYESELIRSRQPRLNVRP